MACCKASFVHVGRLRYRRASVPELRSHGGRLPFVYLVLEPSAVAKKKQVIRELREMCAEGLPEYVQPIAYKFISSMPMTPIGKVDYRRLEEEVSPRDY